MQPRHLVISADGHAGPPAEVYRGYLDPGFRERFDVFQQELSDLRAEMADRTAGFQAEWEEETGGDGGLTAAFDSSTRNAVLDDEGVACEVLFPDADVLGTGRIAASPFGTGLAGDNTDAEAAVAGSRAHNRWLADFVAQDPHRRIGVAVVPAIIPDLDTVLSIVAEAKEQGALRDPHPHPLVRAPGLPRSPLRTAVGAGRGARAGGAHALRCRADRHRAGTGHVGIYASEAGWWAARPLAVLIWCGVFERHPNLRYSMAENGAWWVPDQIRKMDEKWVGGHNTRKFGDAFREGLSMKPSQYLDRNCFFAASTPGVDDIERRHLVGVGNLMWGNDLPHPEGTFPYTRFWIRERFKDLPDDETRRILGLTAGRGLRRRHGGAGAAGGKIGRRSTRCTARWHPNGADHV